jgi:hypothetical protein
MRYINTKCGKMNINKQWFGYIIKEDN